MQESSDFIFNNKMISVLYSDITYETTEAIVNAAKSSLLGGGGVDGAIHSKAGPELLEYCKKIGGCSPGNAKITPGYNLKARYIIHAVGPSYSDGKSGEEEKLKLTYCSVLEIARSKGIESISFPSISTGHYRFPIREASEIAVSTVIEHLKGETSLNLVKFILYGGNYKEIYIEIINKYLNKT